MSKFKDIRREMKDKLEEYEEKIAEFGEHVPEISAAVMKETQQSLTKLVDEMESHLKAWQSEMATPKAQEQIQEWSAKLSVLKEELHTSTKQQFASLRSLEEKTREKLRALKDAEDGMVAPLTIEAVHALDDLKRAIEHVLPHE